MEDFFCTEPSQMYYNILAERTKYFKESKEGVAVMCKAMEDMWEQALKEGREENSRETAKKLLEKGKLTIEEIAECCGLTEEEVKTLQ